MNKRTKLRGWRSAVAENVAAVLVTAIVIEISLHLSSALVPAVDALTRPQAALIEDDRLGVKGNPNWPDHDVRGFRNATALEKASVVALGDSHTYGTNVAAEEAWPSVLARLQEKPVYNMGTPGNASSHAFDGRPVAMSLDPETIIFALYFGNDFCDEFLFARRNDLTAEHANVDEIEKIMELERRGTIEDEIAFLFGAGTDGSGVGRLATIKTFVKESVRTYGLLSAIHDRMRPESGTSALMRKDFAKAVADLSAKQLEYVSIYEGPDWKTIFTARYRFLCLDDSDPRVTMGVKISMENIGKMHRMAQEKGIRFYVLLMPTKEFVFFPKIENREEHRLLSQLIENEERIGRQLKNYIQDMGIVVIDPVPELRIAESQPYFQNGDGHPNAAGHEIVARKVFEVIGAGKS